MTATQKEIIDMLLEGMYLMQRVRFDGTLSYKMYKGNMVPVRYFTRTSISCIKALSEHDLFKKDKKQRLTLHLGNVRRLHGRSWIKQRYYQSSNTKKK